MPKAVQSPRGARHDGPRLVAAIAAIGRVIAWIASSEELPSPPPPAPRVQPRSTFASALFADEELPPPPTDPHLQLTEGWWRWLVDPDRLPSPAGSTNQAAASPGSLFTWLLTPERIPDPPETARPTGGPGAA